MTHCLVKSAVKHPRIAAHHIELRRVSNLLDIANTLPLWERPAYLMERLPATLLAPEVQRTRITAAQKAWQRDPEAFMKTFVPMFLGGIQKRTVATPQKA